MFKKLALSILCLLATSSYTYAYEIREAFTSKHFAVNEVILSKTEAFDDELLREIKRDVLSRNRTGQKYQSTTAIFPSGSVGLQGKTNERTLGILDVRNYPGTVNQTNFYDKLNKSAYAGIIIPYDFLKEMVDQKVLNPLLEELDEVPVVYLDVPVDTLAKSSQNEIYVTNRSNQVIMDIKILGSDFYENFKKELKVDCKIAILAFGARQLEGIPLFLGLNGALNNINCNVKPTDNNAKK